MLTPEQTEQIKNQILEQIETNFPEDKKEFAKEKIRAMDSEELEKFLEQNKLIKTKQGTGEQQCIFCSIVFGDISSYKIEENDKAIAVLEINPISRGHTIIIPKEHISSSEKLPQKVFSLAQEVSKRIKTKLKPKEVSISSSNLFGHEIINLLPVYGNETPSSERRQEEPGKLKKLQEILVKKTTRKAPKKTVQKPKRSREKPEKIWLPKRIP